jgi:hypothetical protein
MIHLGFKTSGTFSAGNVEANKTCYNDVGTKGVFACDPGKPARHRQVLPGARFAEPAWLLSCLAGSIPTGPNEA